MKVGRLAEIVLPPEIDQLNSEAVLRSPLYTGAVENHKPTQLLWI